MTIKIVIEQKPEHFHDWLPYFKVCLHQAIFDEYKRLAHETARNLKTAVRPYRPFPGRRQMPRKSVSLIGLLDDE
jgi:hypothetical protein